MISSLNLHVSWKPVNPQECVWKNLYRIIMKTILQERETIHYSITICTQIYSYASKQWRYPQHKQQWIKDGKNLKRFRRGTKQKSETNLAWLMKQEKKVEKYTSLHWWPLSFEECRIGDKAPKIQRSSCTPRRHCERWFWILCSIHWTRIISFTNDGSTGHGYHIQTARVRRTRDEWNHLLCLFNMSHVSSINKCKAMSKRTQEDAGEGRVKIKADDEFGIEKPCKGSNRLDCIWKTWGIQIWKSESTSELVKMCSKHVRWDPYCWLAHQTPQNGTMTTSGLLKCGNLVKCREQVRGDPYLTSWSSILIWTLTPPQNRTFL